MGTAWMPQLHARFRDLHVEKPLKAHRIAAPTNRTTAGGKSATNRKELS
jgi:hypothetical protein